MTDYLYLTLGTLAKNFWSLGWDIHILHEYSWWIPIILLLKLVLDETDNNITDNSISTILQGFLGHWLGPNLYRHWVDTIQKISMQSPQATALHIIKLTLFTVTFCFHNGSDKFKIVMLFLHILWYLWTLYIVRSLVRRRVTLLWAFVYEQTIICYIFKTS